MDLRKNTLLNALLYGAATVITIAAQVLENHPLEYVSKPLMMLVLSSWFFFNSRRVGDRFTLLVQAGLFFSLIGDVMLMFQHIDEFLFMIGLAAFLLAHVCYAIAFAHNVFEIGGSDGTWVIVLLCSVVLVPGTLFLVEVANSPGVDDAFRLPVVLYTIAITVMGLFAAMRFRKTFDRSFWMVFAGAVLFMVSDALLANKRFSLRPFAFGQIWIMGSYAAAQALIAAGCLLHVLDPETIRRRQAQQG